jgi:hypothetical protein
MLCALSSEDRYMNDTAWIMGLYGNPQMWFCIMLSFIAPVYRSPFLRYQEEIMQGDKQIWVLLIKEILQANRPCSTLGTSKKFRGWVTCGSPETKLFLPLWSETSLV